VARDDHRSTFEANVLTPLAAASNLALRAGQRFGRCDTLHVREAGLRDVRGDAVSRAGTVQGQLPVRPSFSTAIDVACHHSGGGTASAAPGGDRLALTS
jgi:hypothetical protein